MRKTKSLLVVIPMLLVVLCGSLILTACPSVDDKNQPLELSDILQRLSDNKGNLTANGTGNIVGMFNSFQRTLISQYEVNDAMSFLSETVTHTQNGETDVFYDQYFYQLSDTSKDSYYRRRYDGELWDAASYTKLSGLLNAFLIDANFSQVSEDMFSKQGNGNYMLKKALALSPAWGIHFERLESMTIIPQSDGVKADFVLGEGGTFGTGVFSFDVTFCNSTLTKPSWASNAAGQAYSLSVDTAGQGLASGAGTFQAGSSTTVSATANSGNAFDGWYQSATKVSSSATYTFLMPSNALTLTARFRELTQIEKNLQTIWTVMQSEGSLFNDGTIDDFRRIMLWSSDVLHHELRITQTGVIQYLVTNNLSNGTLLNRATMTFGYATINSANRTFSFTVVDSLSWVGGTGILTKQGSTVTTSTVCSSGDVGAWNTATTNSLTCLSFEFLQAFFEYYFETPLFMN